MKPKPRRCSVCNRRLANHSRITMHKHCAALVAVGRFGEPEVISVSWDDAQGDIKTNLADVAAKMKELTGYSPATLFVPKQFLHQLEKLK